MNRRGFITGLISLVAAPAIVRAGSLMPVKSFELYDGVALNCMPHPEAWGNMVAGNLTETSLEQLMLYVKESWEYKDYQIGLPAYGFRVPV
jgi:hypothetical protein